MAAYPITRRNFMAGSAAAAGLVLSRGLLARTGDPTTLTIHEAAAAIRAGDLSPVELVNAYLDRIRRLDSKINSYITVTADAAVEQALQVEKELSAGRWRGPLHGIPIALKDNIDTAGVKTTAASALFADRVPDEDAEVVRRLKRGGAVILGKLNLHEFAYGGSSAVTHFGPVHNPWNLDYIPGGSSGGPAAAVAARLCAGALGTDTAASIRMPAAFCSVTGLKPTYGLASIRGIIPLVESLDHVGPMCRSAIDCALMLQVLAGFDPEGVASIRADIPNYSRAQYRPTSGMKLGIPNELFYDDLDPEIEQAMNEAIGVLSRLTTSSRDVSLPETPDFIPLLSESYSWHAEYMENQETRKLYQPMTRERLQNVANVSRMDYIKARRGLARARRLIDLVFRDVDLLITPTTPKTAHPIGKPYETGQVPEITARNTLPFDFYGIPTITVPCGFSRKGLPIGLQISGPYLGELDVMTLAHAYERATEWHHLNPPLG